MKKLLSALLVLALLFSLASCGASLSQNTEPPVQENLSQNHQQETREESPDLAPEPEIPAGSQADDTAGQTETSEPAEPETTTGPAQTPAEEATEPPAQTPTQEPAEEPTEDPTEESTEEPAEDPTGESTEEPTEEPTGESPEEPTEESTEEPTGETESEPYSYTGREEVAAYIHAYGCLPDNFITKSEARALGWRSGSVERYAPGMCIGGDRFYNREGLLPDAPGRYYYECDIDTLGKSSRGAKRIVFSNDGLIYYTDDHYSSFTLLYGEP